MMWSLLGNEFHTTDESITMSNRTPGSSGKKAGMVRGWLLGMTVLGLVFPGHAADDDATTATKAGRVTIYNEKRGMGGTDVKAGPVTTSDIPPLNSEETLTTATRIGNVTELTGSKGSKSTVVTVGPMTGGQVNGKNLSVVRIGENVAIGTDENGGTMKALQVGNQVVVQKSGNVSPSEVRIIVRVLQEPVSNPASGDRASDNGVSMIPFTGVDVAGDIEVDVDNGQAFEIAVANPQMQKYTTFDVENGVLRIRCVGTRPGEQFFRRVVVRLPALAEATASEGAQMAVRNVTGARCAVVSRSGGTVDVSGKADTIQCQVSGGGHVLGKDLRARRMAVRMEGDDGEVHCTADQELVVVISGKSVVWSHGQPGLVTRKISGGGELKFEK